ncbi:MAG: hypothetical protein M3Q79_04410 [bacterium]|nr:hypothetical protein [bacterium]
MAKDKNLNERSERGDSRTLARWKAQYGFIPNKLGGAELLQKQMRRTQ